MRYTVNCVIGTQGAINFSFGSIPMRSKGTLDQVEIINFASWEVVAFIIYFARESVIQGVSKHINIGQQCPSYDRKPFIMFI